MRTIKLFIAAILVFASVASAAPVLSAKENAVKEKKCKIDNGPYLTNRFKDNWFVGASGGVNMPFRTAYKPSIAPALNVSLGKWITPNVGLSINYTGINGASWSPNATLLGSVLDEGKNMYKQKYRFIYINAHIMWNVSNFFGGYKEDRLWSFIPYAHFGWMQGYQLAKHAKFEDNELGLGVGLLNSVRLHDLVDLTIDINSLFSNGRYHNADGGCTVNLSAAVGISVNLSKKGWTRASEYHNPVDTDQISALEASQAALAAANEALKNDNVKLNKENDALEAEVEELRKRPTVIKAALENVGPASVYFEIGQTVLSQKELQHLDYYLKNVLPNVSADKVAVLTGSADIKTGTMRRNQYLSKKRVEYVQKLLKDKYGIEPDRFQIRTQVAKDGEAALNRAVIISFE